MKIISLLTSLIKGITLVAFLLAYWQVRNLDPEGACKEFKYFFRCWDAWLNYHPTHNFKKLPTDDEMIEHFRRYFDDLDKIRVQALSNGFYSSDYENPKWKVEHGVYQVYKMIPWPPSIYSSSHSIASTNNHEWAYKFLVDSTMYIAGAGKEWPWVNRLKGYAYFPLPKPRIEQGKLLGTTQFTSGQRRFWRVLTQLDKDWPEDWASGECLLRRIDPQWFLILCKDHIGG
jgi:hypothetical protein